jgi:hypothetical protein
MVGAGALCAAVLLGPGAARAATSAQVVSAWSFDQVGADGSVADVSGLGQSMILSGAFTSTDGRGNTPAVRFSAQSFGTASVPAPGTSEVAVTVVFRSLVPKPFHDTPNLLQAGLFNDPSQIKLQLAKAAKGEAQCRFKGSRGALLVTGPKISVTDGAWHTATCWRQGATVGVTVDGSTVTKSIDVGSIEPIRAMTVAARGLLPGDLTDQFLGDIDAVTWAIGDGARSSAVSYASGLAWPAVAAKKKK